MVFVYIPPASRRNLCRLRIGRVTCDISSWEWRNSFDRFQLSSDRNSRHHHMDYDWFASFLQLNLRLFQDRSTPVLAQNRRQRVMSIVSWREPSISRNPTLLWGSKSCGFSCKTDIPCLTAFRAHPDPLLESIRSSCFPENQQKDKSQDRYCVHL